MAGFKPQTSAIGGNRSINCATIGANCYDYFVADNLLFFRMFKRVQNQPPVLCRFDAMALSNFFILG